MLLIALVVIVGFAWYVLTPAERTRTARTAVALRKRHLADLARKWHATSTPFDARAPGNAADRPGHAGLHRPEYLRLPADGRWIGLARQPRHADLIGGCGPSTSNGQWWRLVTSMFVHAGFFSLLIDLIGLAQLGYLLERMTGPVTVAAIYLGAGVFAGLVNLSGHPIPVQVGATAGVLGLYGLFAATIAWSLLNRSEFGDADRDAEAARSGRRHLPPVTYCRGLDRTAALAAFGLALRAVWS